MAERKFPPDDRTRLPEKEDMPQVWDALEKARSTWPLLAPFVALYRNWQALFVVLGVTMALNGPRVIEILQSYFKVAP